MGIALSLLVALIDSFNNVFLKRGTKKFSIITVTWAWQAFSLLILLPILVVKGIPEVSSSFFMAASIKVVLQTGSLLLYSAALSLAAISLTVPMLAFTPIITLIISRFLNNEVPSKTAILGVVLIIIGAYWINVSKDKKGLLVPIKAVFENKGVFYMFLVAVIWGFTSSIDKVAVINSSPVFYAAFVALCNTLLLTPLAIMRHKHEFIKIFSFVNLRQLVPIGLMVGLLEFTQMTAVSLTFAAYVVAIKRSSIILSSILGHFIFGENIRFRIKPILLMFCGILLILVLK